jgi:hypothetical protein
MSPQMRHEVEATITQTQEGKRLKAGFLMSPKIAFCFSTQRDTTLATPLAPPGLPKYRESNPPTNRPQLTAAKRPLRPHSASTFDPLRVKRHAPFPASRSLGVVRKIIPFGLSAAARSVDLLSWGRQSRR